MRSPFAAAAAAALAITACLSLPGPAAAQAGRSPADTRPGTVQTTPVDGALIALPAVIAGRRAADTLFHPAFLQAVAPDALKAAFDQLTARHGAVIGTTDVRQDGPFKAVATLRFERARVPIRIEVAPAAPYQVTTFWFGEALPAGDDAATLTRDIAALPGAAAVWIGDIAPDGTLVTRAAHRADAQGAVGSVFKLYVLEALAAEVAAGRLAWDSVVTTRAASFSSSVTERWPENAPVTLHTLAGWMIAHSDNGATDTLVRLVGQDAIARAVAASGHSRPIGMTPMLTTVEAFALKVDANDDLRRRWTSATPDQRRVLLADNRDRLTLAVAASQAPTARPRHIDTAEWFASPRDMAAMLARLARPDRADARAILGINPGLSMASRGRWDWVGYKGGSETGVIAMAYLARAADGGWRIVTGSWNNPAAPVDDAAFSRLMDRALALPAPARDPAAPAGPDVAAVPAADRPAPPAPAASLIAG